MVMIQKICPISKQTFTINKKDEAFYDKMGVCPPTLSPDERSRRRMVHNNRRHLYKRKCDLTGESMVSIYSPEYSGKVYKPKAYFHGDWDPRDYGRDFDFSRPFFDQYKELFFEVPKIGLAYISSDDTIENSEYTNDVLRVKNCYLCFDGEQARDCLYVHGFTLTDECLDCSYVYGLNFCYECVNCDNGYELFYSFNCENCQNSWFLRDCIGCRDCFGCSNLHQKQYYIYNKPHTKEAYEIFMNGFDSGSYEVIEKLKANAKTFQDQTFVKYYHGQKIEDSTGDFLYEAKDCAQCFECKKVRDCSYSQVLWLGANDCYDYDTWGDNAQLVYESICCGGNIQDISFCYYVAYGAKNVSYSKYCWLGVENLFGCTDLKKAKNCILNKNYTQNEFDILRSKIIGHMKETGEWGEFFPAQLSPFAYNQTVAQEYFPLTKQQALERGYRWREELSNSNLGSKEPGFEISDNIKDIPDSICNQTLYCLESGKPYRIQKAELRFYRKMKLPIPRLHHDIRHRNRMNHRNPRCLYDRVCPHCQKATATTYAPDYPEKVLCEECYLQKLI